MKIFGSFGDHVRINILCKQHVEKTMVPNTASTWCLGFSGRWLPIPRAVVCWLCRQRHRPGPCGLGDSEILR